MADVLAEICLVKREHVAARKREVPLRALEARLPEQAPPRGFVRALRAEVARGRPALIAEIKRASPSRGLIRADFDPPGLARAYARGGAACLSVLTDGPYFQGADRYLTEARAAVDLPCLRKDFTLDPYQVVEARAIGADAVLLIMAALDAAGAKELLACALGLGMDVLVEVHDGVELDRALRLDGAELIGINNRNLKSLRVDLNTTVELARRVPDGRLLVCESGIHGHADLQRMRAAGAHVFLVGESLMRRPRVDLATAELLGLEVPAA